MSFYTKGIDARQRSDDRPDEKEPPHSIEAEQSLLGAILVYSSAIGEVIGVVEPNHFFEPLHGRIFEAMLDFTGKGKPVTAVTLMSLFQAEPPIGELTVPQYLGRLASAATTIINVRAYAGVVRDHAMRREMIVLGETLSGAAWDHYSTVSDIGSKAVDTLTNILTAPKDGRKTTELVGDTALNLIARIRAGDMPDTVPTGISDFDRHLVGGGFQGGELIFGAARPGMGKSTFAPQIGLNQARAGYGVIYQSLEMSKDALTARCLSSLIYTETSPIPYSDISSFRVPEGQLYRLDEAQRLMDGIPLLIDDQGGLTVAEIAARARVIASRWRSKGVPLRGLIIDHLGKIKPSSRYAGQRVQEVGEISDTLMALAKELGIYVFALSQLSRKTEQRDNKRPELQDLRDSGCLEQDADKAIFFYREAYYHEIPEDDPGKEAERLIKLEACWHKLEARIAKQRGGALRNINLFASMPNCAVRNYFEPSDETTRRHLDRMARNRPAEVTHGSV